MADMTDSEDRRRRLPRRARRMLITFGALFALGVAILAGGYFYLASDLPDTAQLAEYEPPLPSHLRDVNGEPFATLVMRL